MSIPKKGEWKPSSPASTSKDKKSGHNLNDSEPVKFDSSIPVPKGKVVTEGYQPSGNKKDK